MAKSYQHTRKKKEYAAVEIEKLKAEIEKKACHINLFDNLMIECSELYKILDNRIAELKGESNE